MPRQPGDRDAQERLPIKVILPKQGKEMRVQGGGSKQKPFQPVTPAFRLSLQRQVLAIRQLATTESVSRAGSIPLRVRLISKAFAKSHRPQTLFSEQTCPIVGAGALGELYLKGTEEGLGNLEEVIASNQTARIIKELSSLEAIEPVTPNFRRKGQAPLDILRKSPRRRTGFITRVRLFDYGPDPDQQRLLDDFVDSCERLGAVVRRAGYSASSCTYEVECQSADQVDSLSRIVGVRSIAPMPILRTIRPGVLRTEPLATSLPVADGIEGEYPVVAVVDTGISNSIPALTSWIVGRESFVDPAHRNPTHGTFVAGLVCWGAQLNPNLVDISEGPCGVFDVEILPNDDPSYGGTDDLSESEFLQSLVVALEHHAHRIRVWNLSLSSSDVCSLDDFSSFAQELDNLQETYRVSFVLTAGNYENPPLLDYPRRVDQLSQGRITSPADSVLGITVGAISHVDYRSRGPKLDHPSAFSRHGAGPNHIIKPDLVHYGGTCSTDLSHRSGVRSIHEAGSAEDMGTSFSAPLVARALAETYQQITPTPSPVLARALLTHHARDPRDGGRVPDGEENFLGFGRPVPPPYCLACTSTTSTLVFEDTLRPGYYLEWNDFPYPPSLTRDGRYYGEIWMTVAFAPTRGARWGSEYCETHLEASFGVFHERVNRKTGEVSEPFKGLVPPEHKNPGVLYESFQVKELRKWAPVRTYHANLTEAGGARGHQWRLKVRLLTRHGIDQDPQKAKSQPFSLVLTISDPEGEASVYDEMAQAIRARFQAENLAVRATARVRAGT